MSVLGPSDMSNYIRLSWSLSAVSVLLLAVSGYLPWMAPAADATRIPSIGSYLFGYKLDISEILFLVLVTVGTVVAHALPWKRATAGVLCVLGLSYAVLPHYLVAQQSASLPQVFEPMIVGPALASIAGCVAVASGSLLLRDTADTPRWTKN